MAIIGNVSTLQRSEVVDDDPALNVGAGLSRRKLADPGVVAGTTPENSYERTAEVPPRSANSKQSDYLDLGADPIMKNLCRFGSFNSPVGSLPESAAKVGLKAA